MWKNRSAPPPVSMKPNPLSVNFLIFPSGITHTLPELKGSAGAASLRTGPTPPRAKNVNVRETFLPAGIDFCQEVSSGFQSSQPTDSHNRNRIPGRLQRLT